MGRFTRILLTIFVAPWRRPLHFCAAAAVAGATAVPFLLDGVRWAEVTGLAAAGGMVFAAVAALWLGAAADSRDRLADDDARRRAKAASDRMFAEFLEKCVRDQGGTPVWHKRKTKGPNDLHS